MHLSTACQISRVEDESQVKALLLAKMKVTAFSDLEDLNSTLVFLNGDIFGGLTGDIEEFCTALRKCRRKNDLHMGCSVKHGNVFIHTEASRPIVPLFVVESQKLKVRGKDLDPSIPLEKLIRKKKLDFLDSEELQ